jgi:hypothetical protein
MTTRTLYPSSTTRHHHSYLSTRLCNNNMFSSLLLSSVFLSLVPSINSLALRDSDRKCHKPLPDTVELGKSVDLTIDSSSGVSPRKYRIHVPKTYDSSTNVPVIVSFHGRGKDAKFQEKLSQFSNSTYGFEGIVVYPEGVPVSSIGMRKRRILTCCRTRREHSSSKATQTPQHRSMMSSSLLNFWIR